MIGPARVCVAGCGTLDARREDKNLVSRSALSRLVSRVSRLVFATAAMFAASAQAETYYWAAPGLAGEWEGATSWAVASGEFTSWDTASNSHWAYFTNTEAVASVTVSGNHGLYTFHNPNASNSAVTPFVRVNLGGSGTISMSELSTETSTGKLGYMILSVRDGVKMRVTNANTVIGYNGHVVLEDGGSFLSTRRTWFGGSYATSNSFVVCSGSSAVFNDSLGIGCSSSLKRACIGVVEINGGTLNVATNLYIGSRWGKVYPADSFAVDNICGTGVFRVNGGNAQCSNVVMGATWQNKINSASSRSSIIVDDGNFKIDNLVVGGHPTVAGAKSVAVNGGRLEIGSMNGMTGDSIGFRLYLNGGELLLGNLATFSANRTSDNVIVANGGKFVASKSNVNLTSDNTLNSMSLGAKGVTIDTNGHRVNLYKSTTGTGAIVKDGEGTLDVGWEATHTGGFVVNGGLLLMSGTEAQHFFGPVVVKDGAAVSVSATGDTLVSSMTFEGSAIESVAGTLTLNTGAALSFTNIPPETAVITAGGLSVGAASVPISFSLSSAFNLDDKYILISGGVTDTNKFSLVSATLGGEDIMQGIYLAAEDGCLVVRRKPYFYIKIAGSGDSALSVPLDWIFGNTPVSPSSCVSDIETALADAGANGIPVWQSYCLGLEPADSQSVVLCEAAEIQPAGGKVCIGAKNLNVPEGLSGIAVTASLDRKSSGDWVEQDRRTVLSGGSIAFTVDADPATDLSFFV